MREGVAKGDRPFATYMWQPVPCVKENNIHARLLGLVAQCCLLPVSGDRMEPTKANLFGEFRAQVGDREKIQ